MGLRIAVLSRNFATTGGGAERYSIAVVEQLADRHDIHVFAQNIEHDFPGVTYHRVAMPLRRPRWINQLFFAAATWWATRKGFDVVHSHENTWHGNVQTVHVLPIKHTLFVGKTGLSLALRCLKIATSPRLLAYLWLEKARYALNRKRRIVLTSQSLRKVMQTTYPHAQAAMNVIAPGVSHVPGRCSVDAQLAARVALGLPTEGYGMLFVGNDFLKKGLPTLLSAVAALPSNTWLAVVGESAQRVAMQAKAKTLGVDGRVHFLGALKQVDEAYCAVDCLVHPTLEDTYAMVVLEAMAHGLPAVVSNAGYCGIAADLSHRGNVILLNDPKDVAEIVAGVFAYTSTDNFSKIIGSAASQFAHQHSWKSVADAYDRIYYVIASDLA
jgi:glycosyltransferase involved in cell wall biosynthesis